MKIEVFSPPPPTSETPITYPVLMEYSGPGHIRGELVFLFLSESMGIVLRAGPGDVWKVGEFSGSLTSCKAPGVWRQMRPEEKVTLSNL
jgi:hypothetical protein